MNMERTLNPPRVQRRSFPTLGGLSAMDRFVGET